MCLNEAGKERFVFIRLMDRLGSWTWHDKVKTEAMLAIREFSSALLLQLFFKFCRPDRIFGIVLPNCIRKTEEQIKKSAFIIHNWAPDVPNPRQQAGDTRISDTK